MRTARLATFSFATLAACAALGAGARAAGVTFSILSATAQTCSEEYDGYYGYYWTCDGAEDSVAISPPSAQGTGSRLELDVTGRLFGGSVTMEAHQLGATAVPAWTRTLAPSGATGIASIADSGVGPWPPPSGPAGMSGASYELTRFVSQSDFDGRITVTWDEAQSVGEGSTTVTAWRVVYAFSAIPGSSVACAGDRIFLDDDADGETNERDRFDSSWVDAFGGGVDEYGATIADVCNAAGTFLCRRVDFRNDEPLRKKPRDCRLVVPVGNQPAVCSPGEIFARSPAVTLRTCSGLPVVDDADGDGEPNGTDRCASTPAGAIVDGAGCSAAQFCAAQAYATCRRSDFGNDEPLRKRPGDCERVKATRSCAPALP